MKYKLSDKLDRQKAIIKFQGLIEEKKDVEIKEIRNKRTIKQNAYLHICVSLFGIQFGYTIEESKTHLKRNCNFMVYDKEGERFLKQTRGMDSKELTDFIDWIRNYSAQQHYYIPTADEYLENRISIDQEIDSHKQYL